MSLRRISGLRTSTLAVFTVVASSSQTNPVSSMGGNWNPWATGGQGGGSGVTGGQSGGGSQGQGGATVVPDGQGGTSLGGSTGQGGSTSGQGGSTSTTGGQGGSTSVSQGGRLVCQLMADLLAEGTSRRVERIGTYSEREQARIVPLQVLEHRELKRHFYFTETHSHACQQEV
jgi:hypothetical protein